MLINGKPDIVLKTVKRFYKKKNWTINFDLKKSLKLGIVVLVMFKKMWVIVFTIDFYSGYGPGSQKPSLSINLCPFLTHRVIKYCRI